MTRPWCVAAPLGCYQCQHCAVIGELYEPAYTCRDCSEVVCPSCRNTARDEEDEGQSTTVCKKCEADQVEVLDYYRTRGGTV